MAGFEDLIRGTLRKHGDATPEARATIYHSSRQALERMLSQNKALDPAAQGLQRQRLEKAINDIEADYLAQADPLDVVAPPSEEVAASPPVSPIVATPVSPPSPPPPPSHVAATSSDGPIEPQSQPNPMDPPAPPVATPSYAGENSTIATAAEPTASPLAVPPPLPPSQVAATSSDGSIEPPSQPNPMDPPAPPAATPSDTGEISTASTTAEPTASPLPVPPPLPSPPPQTPASQSTHKPEPPAATMVVKEISVGPGVEAPPIPNPPTLPSTTAADSGVETPATTQVSTSPSPAESSSPPPVSQAILPEPQDFEIDSNGFDQPEADTRDAYMEAFAASASQERKPYAKLLLWTIILVGIGVAIWWAINFGPALIKQQLGGSVPNPGQTIESGQFVPGEEDGWVTAFNPGDDSVNIETGGRGTAEIFQNENENFVRLASNAGGSENNLRILVPRGVMLPLKGEAVTIEVLIKSSAKTNHQFAVYCDFGDMGSCGRKRFTAANRVEAQIFDVLLNNVDLGPDEDAYLNFNTDLGGEGRAVDVYAIRLRPSS